MRYLTLAEALVIAEAVTGIDVRTLTRASRLDLLDSALHAPQAGFGDEDFYPDLLTKAAALVVRVARNHPLPDGNKRLAWQAITMSCALNGTRLEVPANDAVAAMLAIASGEWDEERTAAWLRPLIEPAETTGDSG